MPSLPPPPDMLHVLSYNVMFGRRSKKIFPWLTKQKNVDIFCLQEFPEHTIDELKDMLPRYQFAFAPSMRVMKKTYGVLTVARTKMTTHRIPLVRHRMALATVFTHKQQRIVLINLHLSWLAANKHRYLQIEKILDDVKSYRTPICMIGDFNIPSLLAKNKLIAFMRDHGFTTFEKRMTTHRLARVQLDYAFVRKGKISKITIERVPFSDHYPIRVDIAI